MTADHSPNQEQQYIRQQLEQELQSIQFHGHDDVLHQTHPESLRSRIHALWNYEFELSLRPIGITGALAAATFAACLILFNNNPNPPAQDPANPSSSDSQRQLIQIGGNTYWQDQYEQAVKHYES
ncbi:hypothetical protein [Paenibacillus bovis]|uniref:Uncharacterized protein n=1 Tax=Paenibacillus bovis TaxID=1616788 RepID=A0A172ZH49_9BACL|nr:hypothetical protein [Paenibacillus bovis]ANF96964.1 hypothetical protein AR543_13745 [Paenibacillus bovis]